MLQLQPPPLLRLRLSSQFLMDNPVFRSNCSDSFVRIYKNQSSFEDLILVIFLEQDGGAIISTMLVFTAKLTVLYWLDVRLNTCQFIARQKTAPTKVNKNTKIFWKRFDSWVLTVLQIGSFRTYFKQAIHINKMEIFHEVLPGPRNLCAICLL